MNPRLPPLNSLRTFVLAARNGSFAAAAEDLCVTPAAVSRSIRALEDFLGCTLFRRLHRQVVLTREGQFYFEKLDGIFDQIALATQNLIAQRADQPLVVSAFPSFLVNWLVPRWSRFLQDNPPFQLKLVTTYTHDISFEDSGIDVAILTDRPQYPHCISTRLFTASLVPVCSPNYLPPGTRVHDVEEWQNALLHSETRPNDWARWARENGMDGLDTGRGQRFENAPLLYEAAIAGLGLAIGIEEVLSRDFASGRLQIAFEDTRRADCPFYVIRPPATEQHPHFAAFHDWLTAQVTEAR